MKFFDEAGDHLLYYNPDRYNQPVVSHTLASNEELIGVYGVKDTSNYFSSFGFILRVR